jgi:ABC-type branched-subunit amino acid transport system substrate-binding protein
VDPGVFVPAGPTRALDTRSKLGAVPVGGHRTLSLAIAGHAGVPATQVRAVVMNVTLTGPIAPGFITVYPDGTPLPTASDLNFVARQTVPNLVVAPVGTDGKIDFYNGSSNSVQLIADVEGYDTGVLGEPGASCTGVANSTGITDSTISIANASDISGPVSGIDVSAQQATQAYAAYFDAGADLCGRTLSVDALDTETSQEGDQAAATTACADDFAIVGSMSTFDDGGAATAAACGIPDLRAGTSSVARQSAADVYAVHYANLDHIPAVVPNYFVQNDPAAVTSAAYLYLDTGNGQAEAASEIRGWSAEGFKFVYTSGIAVTALNYAPFVSKMQAAGVRYVQFDGAYQYAIKLIQAMHAHNFTPIVVIDPVADDPGFIATGGADVDGTFSFTDASLLTDTPTPADMALYEHWLQIVAPGATPTSLGLYAWSAATLFTDQALALGGTLTRAGLLSSLGAVHAWTGNGLHTAQDVGGKTVAPCQAIIQVNHGAWTRASTGQYVCGPLVPTSS